MPSRQFQYANHIYTNSHIQYHDPASGLLSPGIFDVENIREDGQALTRTLSQKGLEIKTQSLSQFLVSVPLYHKLLIGDGAQIHIRFWERDLRPVNETNTSIFIRKL